MTTTPETEATPRPWAIEQPTDTTPNLWIVGVSREGRRVDISKIEVCNYDDGLGERLTAEDHANAALIVRCVNSHAALVEALGECLLAFSAKNLKTQQFRALMAQSERKTRAALKRANNP